MGNRGHVFSITSTGQGFTLHADAEHKQTIPIPHNGTFRARLINRSNRVQVPISTDREQWTTVADALDASRMHHNTYGGFFALRPALASLRDGQACFRDFRYTPLAP